MVCIRTSLVSAIAPLNITATERSKTNNKNAVISESMLNVINNFRRNILFMKKLNVPIVLQLLAGSTVVRWTSLPLSNNIVRLAYSAALGSWVTMITVLLCSLFNI